MTIEILQTLAIVAYIAAGLLLLVSIALFFLLEIPKVFGYITGATAKKAIESIRKQNATTGDKNYKPSPLNAERVKVTDKLSRSGQVIPQNSGLGISSSTEKLDTADLSPASTETTVLNQVANETTVLGSSNDGTTVIGSRMPTNGETTVLSQDQIMSYDTQESFGDGLSVDVEMGFAGSSELIE